MTKKPSEMIFISKIKPDGSGTQMVSKRELKKLHENTTYSQMHFDINVLSAFYETYIASGFNSYVVKLK